MADSEIDNIDRAILVTLLKDGRRPFVEIAKESGVSSGTIHLREEKMKAAGVIEGSKVLINYAALGYGVRAFIGVKLHTASDYGRVTARIRDFKEVVKAHYATGPYNIFIEVIAKT